MSGQKIYSLQEIMDGVAAHAGDYNIKKVYLFGSYARGQATTESDLDFLITLGTGAQLFDQYCFLDDMQDYFGKQIDVVSEGALKDDTFARNVQQEKVLLYQNEAPSCIDHFAQTREANRIYEIRKVTK